MNKHIISTAAFLLAGTALSGAATVISTTFSDYGSAVSATMNDTSLSVSSTLYKSGSVSSTDFSSTTECGFKTLGSSIGSDVFAPDTNVGNTSGAQWQATFTYSGLSSFELGSISITTFGFNSGGTWQNTGSMTAAMGGFDRSETTNPGNGNHSDTYPNSGKYVGFTVEYSLDGGTTWAQVDKTYAIDVCNGNSSNGADSKRTTIFSLGEAVGVEASDSFAIRISTSRAYEGGTFAGLSAIKVNDTVLPEPSAFGLLAGLGALALVAARRRRGRRAA